MNPIDLHTHTTASDGTDTPKELIDYALKKKLSAIAITDHDTIDGLIDGLNYAADLPIKVITGIEFSTNDPAYPFDIHILGYCFDIHNADFLKSLIDIKTSRHERNVKIIKKLNDIGFHITMEDLRAEGDDGVITRAHIGRTLLKKGYINKEQKAYEKYIGNNCVAYVPRERLTPAMAIDMIKSAGGIAVLAHPTLYGLNQRSIEQLLERLIGSGLDGVETIYSLHDVNQEKHISDMAKKYNLIMTGGSDYHGRNKKNIDLGVGKGKLFVPETLLEHICPD
ncbi:MAG: PHP domain-containing protein [Vallitaleaceae bacterium]|jgi:predicted metal-dependent phosphoesterase TrpH|nr:PHP domain-containing protein [Vallitaleaceae bacterium]